MQVVLLTVFLSLILAIFFVSMFLFDRVRERGRSAEQNALLLFAEEGKVEAGAKRKAEDQ